MATFFLADIEVLDRTVYEQYIAKAGPIVRRHGGEYVLRSERIEPLGGGWNPARLLLIRFPDRESVATCFGSPEYLAIKHLREQSTRSRAVLIREECDE